MARVTDQAASKDETAADLPDRLAAGCAWVFLTSTAGGIMPATALDGRPVGNGWPGPVTVRIRDRYWEMHHDPRYSEDVGYLS